jgi:hypothetical protein
MTLMARDGHTTLRPEQAEALARVAQASGCVRSARRLFEAKKAELESTQAELDEFLQEEETALRTASDLGLSGALLSIVSGRTRSTVHIRVHRSRKKDLRERQEAAQHDRNRQAPAARTEGASNGPLADGPK